MKLLLSKNLKSGVSASTIKLVAIIAMTLDHIALVFVDSNLIIRELTHYPKIADSFYLSLFHTWYGLSYSFHIIGRVALPIFVFFIVEGVHHTKKFWKYLLTMFGFALISEVPFDLVRTKTAFDFDGQNILFTLILCMIAVYSLYKLKDKKYFAIPIVLVCSVAGYYLNVDYGFKAIIFACIIQLLYSKKVLGYILGCIFLGLFNPWLLCGLLATPLIWLYNGERGINLKYVFYSYYPIHLILIYIFYRFL